MQWQFRNISQKLFIVTPITVTPITVTPITVTPITVTPNPSRLPISKLSDDGSSLSGNYRMTTVDYLL